MLLEKKISIITPVYNQVDFIEQTIVSVLNQNYSNLEYIIIDGGSTDGTLDIIKKYASEITTWISEPDKGMYDAINKGFSLSTGEIMAWINSDDLLLPDALCNMNQLLEDLPQVEWVQGMNSAIDLKGKVIDYRYGDKFSLIKFLQKDYKYIQQECTFWRRSLYERAGNRLDINLKLAGDFELWFRFSQFAKLYNCKLDIGTWRDRPGQLSRANFENYILEAENVIDRYDPIKTDKKRLKQIKNWRKLINFIKSITFHKIRPFHKKLLKLHDIDKAEIIYSHNLQSYIIDPKS
ncbi:glycosyltransferase involved in cell wall biosynthesis [Nonlabens dokdonensis]|jgi:glycosyltransferase involved in cell wall biosynthesis|uniref:Glycosyl transferase, family 2 n=2 Tax=Nonlabens dokdonensis TaxID=328515 RepID=L7WB30_NONDD|nr:glycosyltransferase family 2 protein [Nonlabens dokdonensis]AGC77407.1 glycosyl transferase, family 2 [Nonlabens dokdonensis DSW-6]PZX40933.1 glycosyltransferase involved in cell wall biosynthesis [Nonlabens dokdonensis]